MSFTDRNVVSLEEAKAQLRNESPTSSDSEPETKPKRSSVAKGSAKPKKAKPEKAPKAEKPAKPKKAKATADDDEATEEAAEPKRGRGRPPKQKMPAEQAVDALKSIQRAYRSMEEAKAAKNALNEEMKAKIDAADARFRSAIEVGIPADDVEAAARKLDVVLTGWQHLEESKSEKVEECKVALEDFERLKKAFIDAIADSNQMKFTFD